MVQTQDFIWEQGADLSVDLIYKEGDTIGTAVAVDLSTNYSVRMDIVVPATRVVVYTFNSETIADTDPVTAGSQADTEIEGVLTSGAGGTPNISITVPRSLTLPPGAVYQKMVGVPPILDFSYDLFLRNTSTNKQAKILEGNIEVRKSYTLWL